MTLEEYKKMIEENKKSSTQNALSKLTKKKENK